MVYPRPVLGFMGQIWARLVIDRDDLESNY